MANEEQAQESTQQNQQEINDTPQESVVTKEMVELFGVPNSFEGKPISELAKSYKSVNKEFTKRSQELSELKKQMESKAVEDDINVPDPLEYTDAREYAKAFKDAVRKEAREATREESAYLRQALVQIEAQNISSAIQKEIPDGNPSELIESWMHENGYSGESYPQELQGHPERIVTSVTQWYKAKQLDELKKNISKESGDKAIEAIKKSLKIQPRETDLNSVTKQMPSDDNQVARITRMLEQQKQIE